MASSGQEHEWTFKPVEPVKPCPFCGSDKTYGIATPRNGIPATDPEGWAYTIVCNACGAEGGWSKSETGAVRNWNMRNGES